MIKEWNNQNTTITDTYRYIHVVKKKENHGRVAATDDNFIYARQLPMMLGQRSCHLNIMYSGGIDR